MAITRRLRRIALSLVLIASGTVVGAGPARAGGPKCSYDSSTRTVTATAVADFDQVSMMLQKGEITASGTDCGEATRFNTDKIVVNDLPNNAIQAFITLAGGRFRPGFTDERGRSDEIEFEFNLGAGVPQWFDTHGTDGDDNFRLGTFSSNAVDSQRRLNLNANERTGIDHDVVINGEISDLILEGFDGNDVFNATGGAGTGGVYTERVYLSGYENADRLTGGSGADTITGHFGRDLILGSEGVDDVHGEEGNDIVKGGRNRDTLAGGPGDDDHFGGPGSDDCNDEVGSNTFDGCESINET